MNKLLAVFLFATALTAGAALPQPDLIARIHFAGGDAVAADKNYSAFTSEFSSAEALALRQQIAGRLAPWLAGWLQANTGSSTGADNLRPLFDDLQNAEWYLDAHTSAGKPSGMFAIKLSPARSQLWKTALKSLPFELADARGWLFCLFGDARGKLGDLPTPAPLTGWLECDVNWHELARWYPEVKALDLPETKFSVSASDKQFHINGKFYFPQTLTIKLDPWQIPTNEIHQTLTSFTAVRGFASWLAEQDWARIWQIAPPANQLFIWSLNGMPFQKYAIAPVINSDSALARIYDQLQPVVTTANQKLRFVSRFTLAWETNRINLTGMPIVAPEIESKHGAAGNYLIFSAFPNTPRGRPLPPQLFQTLAQPDLVYYHWEMTAPRFPSQLQFAQLSLMLTRHKQLDGTSAAYKWAVGASSIAGNTVTEIARSAPDQMTFTRTAPAGLTAFEFFALACWLDAPDFPHCNLELPPLPERIQKLRLKQLQSQPAPAPPH